MKAITTKRFDFKDDVEKVVELIIETDDYIYPPMFSRNTDEQVPFFRACFEDSQSLFYKDNILVAYADGSIVGILIAFSGGSSLRLCHSDNILSRENAESISYCNCNYFSPLIESYAGRKDVVYISNVCVDKELRGRGVGGALLEAYLATVDGCAELDVLCDNPAAIGLYKKNGFEILYSEPAFAFDPIEGLRSYKMKRALQL